MDFSKNAPSQLSASAAGRKGTTATLGGCRRESVFDTVRGRLATETQEGVGQQPSSTARRLGDDAYRSVID
jgi:hypothetical protein